MKYLLPISYLGSIEYYAFIIQKEDVLIESQEHFIKGSLRNRCYIYNTNGIQMLSVPKQRKNSKHTIISKISISHNEEWQKKHYQALRSAYNSSPFFKYLEDNIKDIYKNRQDNLFDFNLSLTQKILSFLGVNKEIRLTSEYVQNFNGIDLRDYNFDSVKNENYYQVFQEKYGFIPNLSILDLIANIGLESAEYLRKLSI